MTITGTKPIANCGVEKKVIVLYEADPLSGEQKGALASNFPHCDQFTGLPEKLGYLILHGNPDKFLYTCALECDHRTDRNKETE